MRANPLVVKRNSGFTLVEMVLVIALTGVVGVLAATIVSNQMLGYIDTTRRANLTAKAQGALQLMSRDLRNAIPFSIRISGNAIEWVPIQSYGRYRKFPTAGSGDTLDLSSPDTQFDVFGPMPTVAAGSQLVVANSPVLAAGFNLYQSPSSGGALPAGSHVVTSSAITVGSSGNSITLDIAHQFSQDSIASRFYLINGAASYICNTTSGEINRFQNYPLQSSQPTNPSASPLSGAGAALLVDSVASCNFGYTAINQQYGLVTLELQLSQEGETVSMVRFIHVENRP